MRIARRLGWAGFAASCLLLGGCADLPDIDLNRCGNGILEPELGEDCDSSAALFGEDAECNLECRLVCSTTVACPAEYACGEDGMCRISSGAWALSQTIAQDAAPLGAARLTTLHSDNESTDALLRVSRVESLDADGELFVRGVCSIDRLPIDEPARTRELDCFDEHTVADLDRDGSDDILTATASGLADGSPSSLRASRGTNFDGFPQARHAFYAGESGWTDARPQPSISFGTRPVRLFTTGSEDFRVAQAGRDLEFLGSASLTRLDAYPGVLPEDALDEKRVAGAVVASSFFVGSFEPVNVITVTVGAPGRVEIFEIAFSLEPGASESSGFELQRRVVETPQGAPIFGRVVVLDLNEDGIPDLAVSGDKAVFKAFGYANGTFGSTPPPADDVSGFERGDQMFVRVADVAPEDPARALRGGSHSDRGGLLGATNINGAGCVVSIYERAVSTQNPGCQSGTYTEGFDFASLEPIDLDLDGDMDFVGLDRSGSFEWRPGLVVVRKLIGPAEAHVIDPNATGPFALGDFDADAVPDVLYARPSTAVLGWEELALARGRPLQTPEPSETIASFPRIHSISRLSGGAFRAREFVAIIEDEGGEVRAVRFDPQPERRPVTHWPPPPGTDSGDITLQAPYRNLEGEFDGDPSAPDFAVLMSSRGAPDLPSSPSLLAHVRTAASPVLDVFDARTSAGPSVTPYADDYAVLARVGVAPDRDALLIANPADVESPTAGSVVSAASLADDRTWNVEEVIQTAELLAFKPLVFSSGLDITAPPPFPPLFETDPLGEDRAGSTAVNVDVTGDGLAEALLIPGDEFAAWLLLGANETGGVELLAIVDPPVGTTQDAASDPTDPTRVFWTGSEGTFAARIRLLEADQAPSNIYGVLWAQLTDVQQIEDLSAETVAAGNFDTDGLVDVAVGDATAVRIYTAVPTIE